MTVGQISEAMKIAKSGADLSAVDDSVLFGCGTANFVPVIVDMRCVAKFLRWQCICLNGEVDNAELANLGWVLKNRIRVV